jgi:FkbM family methyltransferase
MRLTLAESECHFIMDDMDGLDHVVTLARKKGLAFYEEPYPAFMSVLLREFRGCFLDVGANTGLYTLMAAAVRPDLIVHAFEPLPPIAEILARNIRLNPAIKSRIVLHRLALSNATGEADFFETINPYGLLTTSSGLNEAFSRERGETRLHKTATVTMDDWCAHQDLDDIALIKIDVEGFEREVLQGAQFIVPARRPPIGVELLGNADFAYFSGFLERNNYIDCVLTPGRMTFASTPAFVAEGWNHMFIPEELRGLALHCAGQIRLEIG